MAHKRKWKKIFACGHRGMGQYCHTCAAQQQARLRQAQRQRQQRQQRQQWAATFNEDAVNLRHLPKHIVPIARQKIRHLQNGGNYRQVDGKRLGHNRSILRVPVTRNYRLLCHVSSSQIVPYAVLSHEDYNAIARNTKR